MDAATLRARLPAAPAWLDAPWTYAAFGLVVAVVTWDPQLIVPAPGLDTSWILGLNLAAADGLDHGTEVVFTYGPLGFLELPNVADGTLAALAGVYGLLSRIALAASLLWVARRNFGWPLALVLAVTVAAVAPRATGSVPLALALVWGLAVLQSPTPVWARRVLVVGGGLLAALEVLVKLNTGVTILLIVAVAVAAMPERQRRDLATLAGTFAVALAALWFAAGQTLGNFDDYVLSSYLVVSGYSEAMQVDAPEVQWDAAAAIVAGIATVTAAFAASAGRSRFVRAAMVAIVALAGFSLWKFGFVRQDAGHVAAYFEGLLVIWIALRWTPQLRFVPVGGIAAGCALVFATGGAAADFTIRPSEGFDQLKTLLVPSERDAARDGARAGMQAAYGLDPQIVAAVGSEPVDARPWEIGLVWAYGLDYDPLPVLQDYQAYDPALDDLNVDAIERGEAPRYVLRHLGYAQSAVVGLDGRFNAFDSPRATLALLCGYRPVADSGGYALLERLPDARCGPRRGLGTVEAEFGEPVTVPRGGANEAVLVRIDGAAASGLERLRALVHRAAFRRIRLDEARANFPSRNAAGPLLMFLPEQEQAPPALRLAPQAGEIAVEADGGFAGPDGRLRYEFEAMRVPTWK